MCGLKTVVTTGNRPDALSYKKARFVCQQLNIPFVERRKKSIQKIALEQQAHIIVAGKERYEYFVFGSNTPFFFHPSSAAFRIKRMLKGEEDTFTQIAQLTSGASLLDCTLGMATDSMMAAYVVGAQGKVVGCEGNPNVAFIVQQGLQTYDYVQENLEALACMRQIEVQSMNAVDYLKSCPDNSFDVVYMDPMFEETIEESINFQPLRQAGIKDVLSAQWIQEAKRVAKKRIVLKAHFRSPLFEKYEFAQIVRKNTKFHYGVLELKK